MLSNLGQAIISHLDQTVDKQRHNGLDLTVQVLSEAQPILQLLDLPAPRVQEEPAAHARTRSSCSADSVHGLQEK